MISTTGYSDSSAMRGMRIQWSYTSLSLSETPIILAPRALISLAPVTMSSNVESPGLITITYTDESMSASGPCLSSPPPSPRRVCT